MPVYSYRCKSCGNKEEKYLKIAQSQDIQICSVCSHDLEKLIDAARLNVDYPGYTCPISGKWIEGKKAHKENLAKYGKRVLEKGEMEDAKRFRLAQDREFERKIDEDVDRQLAKLSTQEMENLAKDVLNSDISINRG